eukprot:8859156-Pyramimonas_sp.AAC.1
MHGIDTDPAFEHAATATGLLGCYFRNRVRGAKEAGETYDVEALAARAVEFGCPEFAESAEAFLKLRYQKTKAGEVAAGQATVSPIVWGEGDEPGTVTLTLAGATWAMLDYRDKPALDPETVEARDGLPHSTTEPPDIKLRERALINIAAAHMIGNVALPEGAR